MKFTTTGYLYEQEATGHLDAWAEEMGEIGSAGIQNQPEMEGHKMFCSRIYAGQMIFGNIF